MKSVSEKIVLYKSIASFTPHNLMRNENMKSDWESPNPVIPVDAAGADRWVNFLLVSAKFAAIV